MKHKKYEILIFPQFSLKIGYGHLKRSLILFDLLKKYYPVKMVFLKNRADVSTDYLFFSSSYHLLKYIQNNKPLFIILDFRYYTQNLIQTLASYTKLILIDSIKTFNINKPTIYFNPTTPIKKIFLDKNEITYEGLEYLPLNKYLIKYMNTKAMTNNNIFICFGNSDPNKLSLKLLKALKEIITDQILFLNIGKYYNTRYRLALIKYLTENFKNYYIIESKEIIIHQIFQCYYLLTSFSLTALEGLILSKSVGLYNNSFYHRKLSRFFKGFHYLGTYPFSMGFQLKRRLKKILLTRSVNPLGNYKNNNSHILKVINQAEKMIPHSDQIENCPICKNKKIKLILNQIDKQIYHCKHCKSKFQKILKEYDIKKIYQTAYFNEEYKKQYGKTYLEDKNNILKLSEQRLMIISQILQQTGKDKKILDVGCAYGFFLLKAAAFQYQPTGLEIEKSTAQYIKNKFKINIINDNFLDHSFTESYDIITFWYVLEHFSDVETVIKKILTILKPGGLLCLAIPNGNGPFYRFNPKEWLKVHPEDHFFDFSIKGMKILLKKNGFCLLKKRVTGFHPERYRNCPQFFLPVISFFNQGDTMELYFKLKK